MLYISGYNSSSNFLNPPQNTIKTVCCTLIASDWTFFFFVLSWLAFHFPTYSFWPLALFSVWLHRISQIKAFICSLLVLKPLTEQLMGGKIYFGPLSSGGISPSQMARPGRNHDGGMHGRHFLTWRWARKLRMRGQEPLVATLFKGPQWPVSVAGPYLVGLHNPQDSTTGGYQAFKFKRQQGMFQIQTIQSKLPFSFPSKWPLITCLFAKDSIKVYFDYSFPSTFWVQLELDVFARFLLPQKELWSQTSLVKLHHAGFHSSTFFIKY